jgi:cytochrome c oxidase subunit 3
MSTNIKNKKFVSRNWEKHQFHLVDSSQLPLLTAFSAMQIVLSIVFYWHPTDNETVMLIDAILMHIAFIMFTFTLLSWFFMIVLESQAGHHTAVVQQGLRLGMVLFIASEVMFFFAFFWAFFHYSLSPSVFIGCVWPPKGTQPVDVWGLPLTNTLLLLLSGVTITIAHNYIVKATNSYYYRAFAKYLFATIILGITFLICQGIEYKYGITFSWKENVYGSIFFILTGFHGFHVTVGTLFLWFCLVRALVTKSWFFGKSVMDEDTNYENTFLYYYLLWYGMKEYFVEQDDLVYYSIIPMDLHKHWDHVLYSPFRVRVNTFMFMSVLLLTNDTKLFGFREKAVVKIQADTLKRTKDINDWLISFGFTPKQHVGFEAAAWYWHFVDVVWLFLFITVYWWGN